MGADLDAGPDALEVAGVASLLRRALRNLLENARRYSQGEITVLLRRQGDMAQVQVCDQGPGVPEALRERIFEPFSGYRVPVTCWGRRLGAGAGTPHRVAPPRSGALPRPSGGGLALF